MNATGLVVDDEPTLTYEERQILASHELRQKLRELFSYDEVTGEFIRIADCSSAKAGSVAGCIKSQGYRMIGVGGRVYLAHRLVWLYIYGRWPVAHIDHINGVRSDNRLENLREATRAENSQNTALFSNNTTGYTGVTRNKRTGTWRAVIQQGGKKRHLGYFDTAEEASQAYLAAKSVIHTFQPTPRNAPKVVIELDEYRRQKWLQHFTRPAGGEAA